MHIKPVGGSRVKDTTLNDTQTTGNLKAKFEIIVSIGNRPIKVHIREMQKMFKS